MNRAKRIASVWFAIVIAAASIEARAQVGPPAGVGNLEDRVTRLEQQVAILLQQVSAIQVALKNEITAREAVDVSLKTALGDETAARAAADAALQTALANETAVRKADFVGLSANLAAAQTDLLNHINSEVAARQAADLDLQGQIAGSGIPGLKDYLTVFTDQTTGYPTVLFKGANVQIVNGLGSTETLNGLGNLIVGYNAPRNPGLSVCSDGQFADQAACEGAAKVWAISHKSGSHNIVGGDNNSFSSFGALVVGQHSVVNSAFSSVSGGFGNTASGGYSSASGGLQNTASGKFSSVSGGAGNSASGDWSSVSGGSQNSARGSSSSVSGGDGCTEKRILGWSVGDAGTGIGCLTGN